MRKSLFLFVLILTLALLPSQSSAQNTFEWVNQPEKVLNIPKSVQLPLYGSPGSKKILGDKQGLFFVYGKYWVHQTKGEWLGIHTWISKKNRLVWIKKADADAFGTYDTSRRKAVVDRSKRILRVYSKGKVVFQTRVSVGRKGAPTPLGKTAVEDLYKPSLLGLPSSYYGKWIFALGLWQNAKTPGFPNGGAVAFHGTPNSSDIGKARSAGCIRLTHKQLQHLKKVLPVGTPVWIKA